MELEMEECAVGSCWVVAVLPGLFVGDGGCVDGIELFVLWEGRYVCSHSPEDGGRNWRVCGQCHVDGSRAS